MEVCIKFDTICFSLTGGQCGARLIFVKRKKKVLSKTSPDKQEKVMEEMDTKKEMEEELKKVEKKGKEVERDRK